ncbi:MULTISPECIES: hypothetical protein [Arthrobacter]|uniref:Uncharacterized protein n=2 Tax=Arthrobacter TaxID=1663 RepID=A0ABU9KHJ2_9MICC|nr:hypothetical protein [Arthrobacter sp. YJM1]MDP5226637.1 hypothetical protein [Arthrobacter sp. YJM1]
MNTKVAPTADKVSPLTREAVQHMQKTFKPKTDAALRQYRHAANLSVKHESLYTGARVVNKRTLATGTVTGLDPATWTATVEWDELTVSNTIPIAEIILLRVSFKCGQGVTRTTDGKSGVVVAWTADMVHCAGLGEVLVLFDGDSRPSVVDTSQLVCEEDTIVPVNLWAGVTVYHQGDLRYQQETAQAKEIRKALRPMGLQLQKNSGKMPWHTGYETYRIVHTATGEVLHQQVHLDDVLEVIS